MGGGKGGLWSNTRGSGCFVAGTFVSTEHGLRPIEAIQVGDYVFSRNVLTSEEGYKKVLQTFVHTKDCLLNLYTHGVLIRTTEEHPFWVEGKGWTLAADIEKTDLLLSSSDQLIEIRNVEKVSLSEPVNVYNFEVDNWHTFCVSEIGVLVHNKALRYVFNSIKESPNYPKGFKLAQNGSTKNTINDKGLKQELNAIESGTWKKIYKDGYDSNGRKISVHYFQSPTGKVFNVKTKRGWSNKTSK